MGSIEHTMPSSPSQHACTYDLSIAPPPQEENVRQHEYAGGRVNVLIVMEWVVMTGPIHDSHPGRDGPIRIRAVMARYRSRGHKIVSIEPVILASVTVTSSQMDVFACALQRAFY